MKLQDIRTLEGVEYENTDNEFIIDAGEVSFKVYIFCEFDLVFDYIEGEKETGTDPYCDLRWKDTWWPHGRNYETGVARPFGMGDNITVKGMSVSIIDADKPHDYGNLLFDYDQTKEGCMANAMHHEVERWMNFTFSGGTLFERICDEIETAREERVTYDPIKKERVYKKVDIRWEETAYESTKNL